MKTYSLPKRSIALLLTLLAGAGSGSAATKTWNGANGADWATGSNWSTTGVPAAADTALFNGMSAGVTSVGIATSATITSISFDTNLIAAGGTTASSFALGSVGVGSLWLQSGGTLQILGTLTGSNKSVTVNTPLILSATSATGNGSYTISNAAGNATNNLLNIAGTVGGSTTTGQVTLTLGGANTGTNTVSGVISNGNASGGLNLIKTGAGQWVLSGSNTYTGSTSVNQGTLTLGGASGGIYNSSAINISGGTLKLDNSSSNNEDRLADNLSIVSKGGGFNFAINSASGNYAETAGTLVLSAGLTTYTSSQAVAGGTSTMTFAALDRKAGAGFNNVGTNLGADARNRLMFTADASSYLVNGILPWTTSNSADFLTIGANGLTPYTAYTTLAATGATIASSGTANVKLTTAGAGGDLSLGTGTTTINSLSSGINTAATVDTAGKTLQTNAIVTQNAKQTLKIGVAAGDGTLTPAVAGGELVLNTLFNSTSSITVNSVIADNGSASSLTKLGLSTAILASDNTISGTTYVTQGTLQLGTGGSTGSLGGPVYLNSGATLVVNRTGVYTPFGALYGSGGSLTFSSGTATIAPGAGTNTFGTLTLSSNAGTEMTINGDAGSNNTFSGIANPSAGQMKYTFAGGYNSFPAWWTGNGNGTHSFFMTGGTTAWAANSNLGYYGGYNYINVGPNARFNASQLGMSYNVNGIAVIDVSGTFQMTGGGGNAALSMAASGTSVYNQTAGAMLATNIGGNVIASNGRGEFNLSGGTVGALGSQTSHTWRVNNGSGVGIMNLNGGTLYANNFLSSTNPGNAYINFNGGTLVPGNGSLTLSATHGNLTVYSGGATFDDAGGTITINQSLAAPTGFGVSALPVTGTMSGYAGAPYVAITGGSGVGATAVADYNPETGEVTGIRITNPGSGYAEGDVLTVTLWKQGSAQGTQTVVAGTATLAANQSGGLTKNGAGTLTLSGTNTYAGTTTLNSGTISANAPDVAGVGGALGNGGNVTFAGGVLQHTSLSAAADYSARIKNSSAAIAINTNGQTVNYAGAIDSSNAAGLNKLGNGILTLSASNSYGGDTTITTGTLRMGHAAAIPSTNISITSGARLDVNGFDLTNPVFSGTGSVVNNADSTTSTLTLNSGSFAGTIISGSGVIGIVKNGSGTLALSGNNTFTGGVVLNSGTLGIGNNSALGSGTLTVNGGSFDPYLGLATLSNPVVFNTGTLNHNPVANQLIFNGPITFTQNMVFNVTGGAGLNVYGGISDGGNGYSLTKFGNSVFRLGGTNTYTGDTRAEGGIVLWHNNAIQNSAFDTNGAGTISINGAAVNAPIIGGLKGSKAWDVGTIPVSLTLNVGTGNTHSYSGVLSGGTTSGMALIKQGLGTQIFSGTASHTGATNVNVGKLVVSGTFTATSSVSVASGAELNVNGAINSAAALALAGTLSGSGSVGAVTADSTAVIAPGNSPGTLSMVSLTGTTGATLSIELGKTAGAPVGGVDYDQVSTGGILLNDMTLTLVATAGTPNVQIGDRFFLVLNQGTEAVGGTFAGLAQGDRFMFSGLEYEISYLADWTGNYATSAMTGGNDIALLVVPEPGTFSMLLGGFGMLVFMQRIRSRRS